MLADLESTARDEVGAGSRRVDHVVCAVLCLHAHPRQALAVALHLVSAWKGEHLVGISAVLLRAQVPLGAERIRGSLEVVVALRPSAGAEIEPVLPAEDVVARIVLVERREPVQRRRDACAVRVDRIAEHDGVLGLGALVEVEDAVVFQEAVEEVVVGLPVLHAILARRVALLQLRLERRHPATLQDVGHDVRGLLRLVDARIGPAREEPVHGDHFRRVARKPVGAAVVREAAHDPVEPADACRAVLGPHHADAERHRLPHDVVRVDPLLLRAKVEVEHERLRHRLDAAEAREQQRVLGERRPDHQPAVGLEVGGHGLDSRGKRWIRQSVTGGVDAPPVTRTFIA